jgi:hypothetical protein
VFLGRLFAGMKAETKTKTMNNLLYIIALILVTAWLIGFVGYNAGAIIHILLALAIIAVLLRIIRGKDPLA